MSNYKAKEMAMAKYLYFNTNKSQKEIANSVKVTEHAVSRWVRREKWAEQKKATYYSPDQVIHQLFGELHKIDEAVNERPDGIPTKEEADLRTKLVNLIHSLQKNGSTSWRNIAAEYDFENKNIVDLEALGALERKNLEKRKKMAEEDANAEYGKRFDPKELDAYYKLVANLKFGADSAASKVGKDGKPLAEDNPQRLKWEELMRQGKSPFRNGESREEESGKESGERGEDENGSGEKKSGRRSEDGRSNDDLPEGWTWMDMPEEDE